MALEVETLLENVPTAISGLPTERIADRERDFIERFTNQNVGSVGIELKWQGPLLDFTMSEVLSLMNTIGADVSSIKLGDFSEKKGGETNVMKVSEDFKKRGMEKLMNIGMRVRFHKSLG